MIQISNYKKAYDGHIILEIANLQLEAGVHWILGKNGSGKSTLFKSILNIIPFEGKIEINGIESSKIEARRLLGFSEAEPKFPATVSGYDILQFMAEIKHADNQQVDGLVKVWGVDLYWKNAIGSYSSGMLKKISLISAFLGKPSWVILDEPFILIDAQTLTYLQELIVNYVRNHNTSFLISSHQVFDLDAALPIYSYLIQDAKIAKL